MTKHLEQRFAAELRAELSRQRRSATSLAKRIGRPTTTVARWLRAETSPTLNEMDAMCQALGMSVADLLAAVERNGGYEPVPVRTKATDSNQRSSRNSDRYEPLVAA